MVKYTAAFAAGNHIDVVELLLDAEVDKELVNWSGWTPLHLAAMRATLLVKLLLDWERTRM